MTRSTGARRGADESVSEVMPYRTALDVIEALCRGRRVRVDECPHAITTALVRRGLVHATLTTMRLTNNAKLVRDSMLRETKLTTVSRGYKPVAYEQKKTTRP